MIDLRKYRRTSDGWEPPKGSQEPSVDRRPPRPIPVIIATTPADLAFQAERAATRYIALNRPTARARLVVIVRELDPDELDRR